MRYRPVDENGDMMPIRSDDQMLHGSYAVAAAVNSRLRLLYGEWWQDEQLGFRLPEYLFSGTRMQKNSDVLISYISSYVRKTQGVQMATCTAVVDDRVMRVNVDIVTDYSDTSSRVEVNENVLLSAIS